MNWRTRRTKYSPSCPLVQTSGRKYRTVLTTGRDENTNCPLGNEHTISTTLNPYHNVIRPYHLKKAKIVQSVPGGMSALLSDPELKLTFSDLPTNSHLNLSVVICVPQSFISCVVG